MTVSIPAMPAAWTMWLAPWIAFLSVTECKRVVCFSTSEVFGQIAFRARETSHTVLGAVGEARWTYAVSKLAEEHMAYAYFKELGLPTVIRIQ